MFDNVRVECPLPDGFEGELQTKDFSQPYMNVATIRSDGRLVYDERHWKERDPATAEDLNFHGMLNFYGFSGKPGESDYVWHEYNAKFTDGRLVSIEVVSND